MSSKVIHIILLLTLLQVTGQLMAFDNASCSMGLIESEPVLSSEHHAHGSMQDSSSSTTTDMVCCDMVSSCTMAGCIALMQAPLDSSNTAVQKSEPVWVLKSPLYSFQVDTLYKPPILS